MQSYNVPPAAGIIAARATCRELLALLMEENSGLTKQDIKLVEERIQHKKRLTLRLEKQLADIKQNGGIWKENADARRQAAQLAEELKKFQELARNNALLLQAAHQLRADLIIAIRNEIDAMQPRAQLYTSSGGISSGSGNTRLLARTI